MTDDDPFPSVVPEEEETDYNFAPIDFPEDTEFDYRVPRPEEERPNPNLLAIVDAYLESANAWLVVRHHIPNLFRLLGAKVADRYNRRHKVHLYGPRIPFRYGLHETMLGASGFGKGATVEQFFDLIGAHPGEPPLFGSFEFKGGSIESMRGGVLQDRPSDPKLVQPGSIERMDFGFLHIPEFTQIVDLGARFGGSSQTLLAWADTGKMSYETISGRAVNYVSGCTLLTSLPTSKLNEVESAAAGWARRTIYDHIPAPRIETLLPENRPPATEGDESLLAEFRLTMKRLIAGYAPTSIDWTPFRAWLSDAYKKNLVVAQDEQMLYATALGHHIVTGGAWVGELTIGVPPSLDAIFKRLVWNKRLARVSPTRRLAHDALDVLEDPYVIGSGATMTESEAKRIISARVSVPEDGKTGVDGALEHLVDKGYIDRFVAEQDGKNVSVVRLTGR